MTIILVEIEKSFCTEFTLFEKINLDLLQETKTINISFSKATKTRINTSMQIGKSRNKINFNIDDFIFFEKSDYSFLSGETQTSHYFVISKKQDFEAYKKYVLKLVEYVFTNILKLKLDTLTIKLEGKF